MAEEKKPGRTLIAKSPDLDESETEAVAAVQAYERQQKKVSAFVHEHNDEVFKPFRELLDKLEAKRVVADAKMRASDASFGPWKRTEQRTYDTEKLCAEIGEPAFIELGGTITTPKVFTLDKETIEVAIAAEEISKKTIEAVRTITPKYTAPKPIKGPE